MQSGSQWTTKCMGPFVSACRSSARAWNRSSFLQTQLTLPHLYLQPPSCGSCCPLCCCLFASAPPPVLSPYFPCPLLLLPRPLLPPPAAPFCFSTSPAPRRRFVSRRCRFTCIQKKLLKKHDTDIAYAAEFQTADRLLRAYESKRKCAASVYAGLKVKKAKTPSKKINK